MRIAQGILLSAVLSAASVVLLGKISGGQQTVKAQATGEGKIGKPLFVTAATSMCGPMEQEYPFDAQTYGKVSGYSPATSEAAKIVLYTRALDKNFFRVAAAIDALVAKNKSLTESLVIVMDEKGAQRGGYSVEEVQQRRNEIRRLAAQNHITHLTFFLSAPKAESIAPRLGLTDTNLLIADLVRADVPDKHALVQWFTRLDTTHLSEQAFQETLASLRERMKSDG